MKKKTLEIQLAAVQGYRKPKNVLEQYQTPSHIAADILFFAYMQGDIENKSVADLGAGTGIFSVGACLLGAEKIYAVEIDGDAVEVLKDNIERFGCSNIEIIQGPVESFLVGVDTVIQNPPFGSQKKHADLPFLLRALEISRVVYTLHNAETEKFIESKVKENGAAITHKKMYRFPIPRTFFFHRKDVVEIEATLFRIVRD